MSPIVGVGLVGAFWISLMFQSTLILWAKLFIIVIHLLKWLFIIGFVVAFLNMPQMYVAVGWTPVSVLLGPEVYDQALNIKRSDKPNVKR